MNEKEYLVVTYLIKLRQAKELLGDVNSTLDYALITSHCRDLGEMIEAFEKRLDRMMGEGPL